MTVLARTHSTQDVVRAAAAADAPEGYCCVATEQTAGRGRQGRRWIAPAGSSLLASVLLREVGDPLLPLAAGLAVSDVLLTLGVPVQLKWPNDVIVEGAKLAGILVEAVSRAAVVGIGLNLTVETFPADVRGASLHRYVEVPNWRDLLVDLLIAIGQRRDRLRGDRALVRHDWLARAVGLGESITAIQGDRAICGTAVGIDDDGALLLDTGSECLPLVAADVHLGTPRSHQSP